MVGDHAGGGKTQELFERVKFIKRFVPNQEVTSAIQPEEIKRLIDEGFAKMQQINEDRFRKLWLGDWTPFHSSQEHSRNV